MISSSCLNSSMRESLHLLCAALIVVLSCPAFASSQEQEPWFAKGKEIYLDQCATCHGDMGQGVDGAYESALEGLSLIHI